MAQALFEALAAGVDNQTALAVQSLLESQTVQEQPQPVDDDDIYQCGKCKKQFYNLGAFINHKQTACRPPPQQVQTLRPPLPAQTPGTNPNSAFTSSVQHTIGRQVYREVSGAFNAVPQSPLTQLAQGMVLTDSDLMPFTLEQGTQLQVGTSIQGNPFLSQVSPVPSRSASVAMPTYSGISSGQQTLGGASNNAFTTTIQIQQPQQVNLPAVQVSVVNSSPVTTVGNMITKPSPIRGKRSQGNLSNNNNNNNNTNNALLTALDEFSQGIKTAPGRAKKTEAEKKLKCEYCDKTFMKNFDLQQHVRSHTGEKPFQCIVCGRAFAQKSNVKKHMQTHKVWPAGIANTLPKEPLVVLATESPEPPETGQPTDQTDLNDPEGKNAALGLQIILDNSYLCQYCPAKFSSYFQLKTHMVDHKEEQVYKCVVKACGQDFKELDSFLEHVKTHEDEMSYRCHLCHKQFPTLYDLGVHQYSHSLYPNQGSKPGPKFFKCVKCSNKYSTPEALQHHMETTTHNYPCPHCEKTFTCERYLRRHLPAHGTLGEHICNTCNKRFKTEHYLKLHEIIHTGLKPFKCDTCGAQFNRKDKLKRHNMIHDPNKRFKCPFKSHTGCTKEFSRPDKLKAHIITHSGVKPFKCTTCGKAFSRQPHLREHMLSHEDKFKYRCATCKKGFHREKFVHNHKCRKPGESPVARRMQKRKVGRPRKYVTALPSVSSIAQVAGKRRRGRPKRYCSDSEDEKEVEIIDNSLPDAAHFMEKHIPESENTDVGVPQNNMAGGDTTQPPTAIVLQSEGGSFTLPVIIQDVNQTLATSAGHILYTTNLPTSEGHLMVTSQVIQASGENSEGPPGGATIQYIDSQSVQHGGQEYHSVSVEGYSQEHVLDGTEHLLEESDDILKSVDG